MCASSQAGMVLPAPTVFHFPPPLDLDWTGQLLWLDFCRSFGHYSLPFSLQHNYYHNHNTTTSPTTSTTRHRNNASPHSGPGHTRHRNDCHDNSAPLQEEHHTDSQYNPSVAPSAGRPASAQHKTQRDSTLFASKVAQYQALFQIEQRRTIRC